MSRVEWYWHGAQRMANVIGNEKRSSIWIVTWGKDLIEVVGWFTSRPRDWVPDDIQ